MFIPPNQDNGDDEAPSDPYVQALHWGRLVEHAGQWFIADANLRIYDDYYYCEVGDVIVVQGKSGLPLFFELASRVPAFGPSGTDGWLILRIDPEREFDSLPVLDVNPEDALLLDRDGTEEAPDSGE